MATIVVTGANGFTGRHLCRALGLQNNAVVALARGPSPALADLAGVQVVQADLSTALPAAALPEHIDSVIHLAQSLAFRRFPEDVGDVFQVHCRATLDLLDLARQRGCRSFIFTSTGGLYGTGAKPFRENDPTTIGEGPLAYYYATKQAAEHLCSSYGGLMAVTILRPFFIYGPGQGEDKLFARLAHRVAQGQPIQLEGDVGIRINPVHVSDMVASIIAALAAETGGLYNVAGPGVISIKAVGERLGQLLGREPVFETRENSRPNDLIGDISKLVNHLHAPTVPPDDGLRHMAEMIAAHSH